MVAEINRNEPNITDTNRTEPNTNGTNKTEPNITDTNRTDPNITDTNRTEPNTNGIKRTEPNIVEHTSFSQTFLVGRNRETESWKFKFNTDFCHQDSSLPYNFPVKAFYSPGAFDFNAY